MRVLQLTKFYAPFRGGIESVVSELTSQLNARGVITDVLCANHERGGTQRQPLGGAARLTRVHSFGRLLSTSMSPAMLLETLRQRSSHDVIHVHLPDPLTNLALWLARPSARIVVHWHSDIIQQKTALKIYAPLLHWLLCRADAIIATSQPYASASSWLSPHSLKVHIVPIGIGDLVDEPDLALVERIRERHGGQRFVFALGRLVYYKGFEHLVRSAPELPAGCRIVIGGTGELHESLEQQIRALGVGDRVELLGNIPEAELHAYFYAATVFCLPSTARSEAFGVVLLEAMRAGKPIVATQIDGSGVPWVNKHGVTGLNVTPGDSHALASAIVTLMEQPETAARYGCAARERFMRMFTAESMANATEHVYRHLLSHPKTPPSKQSCPTAP